MTMLHAVFLGLWTGLAAGFVRAEPVTVFAAASLRGALEEALTRLDVEARISFGGSAVMARQISQGAPVDLVVLAHPQWDEWLSDQGLDGVSHTSALLSNRLVLIGQTKATPFQTTPEPKQLTERLGADGRLAMGQHKAVPVGQYAQEWLLAIGAWDSLKPRLAEAANTRAALAFVARGEAPLGIVYASDAKAEARVSILWDIAPETHTSILYPARAYTDEGADLLLRLQSAEAQEAFLAAGFEPAAERAQ